MDGSGRSVIVDTKITWPNGLTLDYVTERIYWADAREDYIEFASLDGSNRHVVLSQDIPHIFALTLFEDYVYWTDWETKSINRAHKTTGTNKTLLISTLHRPMDLHVFHALRQPDVPNHPCKVNNGGCSNLCLLSPGVATSVPVPPTSTWAVMGATVCPTAQPASLCARTTSASPSGGSVTRRTTAGTTRTSPGLSRVQVPPRTVPVLDRHLHEPCLHLRRGQ